MDAAIQRKCSTHFRCYILVTGIMLGKLQSDLQHVLTEKAHPGRAVGLLHGAAGRQRRAAVEEAYIVHSQEATLEDVVVFLVFPFYPLGENQQQLSEGLFQAPYVRAPQLCPLDMVEEDSGHCVQPTQSHLFGIWNVIEGGTSAELAKQLGQPHARYCETSNGIMSTVERRITHGSRCVHSLRSSSSNHISVFRLIGLFTSPTRTRTDAKSCRSKNGWSGLYNRRIV